MKWLSLIFLTSISLIVSACSTPKKTACDRKILFEGDRGFSFNENEEVLLCGDQKSDGWKDIPFSQREFMVRNFLKFRGYHHSKIELIDDHLVVDPGVRTRIQDVKFVGAPEAFFKIGYVGWKGQLLRTESLDDIEAWTYRRLHSIGYPCARLKILANSDTSIVEVTVTSGRKEVFPAPSYDQGIPLIEGVMRRYDAFSIGEVYDERLLSLTSSRMGQDGVVFKSYFAPECDFDPIHLQHRVSIGEPRLVKIGGGASTEELFFAKASWRHARLGRNASQIYANGYASKIKQSLLLGFDWHFNEAASRWYLATALSGARIFEQYQSNSTVSVSTLLARKSDFTFGTLESKFGPALSYENTFKGLVPGGKSFLRFETEWNFSDYPYQIYISEPREGLQVTFGTSSIAKSRYTTAGAHQLRLSGTRLWNLGNFDPTRFILGVRFGVNTVVLDDNINNRENLPSNFYAFLGGEQNIRGFGRQELPLGQDKSALSSAYTGLEFRAADWLPPNYDPFFFADFGWMGTGNGHFDSPVYLSPGLGMRYQSPVGSLRFSVGHGWVLGSQPENSGAEHFQFFVSLGQEF